MTINFGRGTWPSMVCINGPIRALDIEHPNEYPISMDRDERERETDAGLIEADEKGGWSERG